jgi:hypothetical protein
MGQEDEKGTTSQFWYLKPAPGEEKGKTFIGKIRIFPEQCSLLFHPNYDLFSRISLQIN